MLRQVLTSLFLTVSCVCFFCIDPMQCMGQVQTLTSGSSGNLQSVQGSGQTSGATGSTFGGSAGSGQSAGNSQSGLSSMGTPQNLNTQNSFIGRSDAAQNAFIGRNNAQSTTGRNAAGQNRNFNRATTGGSQNGLNQRNAGQTGPKVPEFRPQIRIAFSAPALPVSQVSTSMGTSLDRIKVQHDKLSGVQFEVGADHSVTLRGQVDSAGTRKLAEFLAMLEPGIRKVNNELTVSGQK